MVCGGGEEFLEVDARVTSGAGKRPRQRARSRVSCDPWIVAFAGKAGVGAPVSNRRCESVTARVDPV